MLNIKSGNQFGEQQKLEPRDMFIKEYEGNQYFEYAGKMMRVMQNVVEPEEYAFNEEGVQFMKDQGREYIVALYNLACLVGNNRHVMDWEGSILPFSNLTVGYSNFRMLKLFLGNYAMKLKQTTNVIKVVEKQRQDRELMQRNVDIDTYVKVYYAIPAKEIDCVGTIPPVQIPTVTMVKKRRPGRVSLYLGNYDDAMKHLLDYPNEPIVYLGDGCLPGTLRYVVGTLCLSWHGIFLDKAKLPVTLEDQPFIYKDWVENGNYVVDENVCADVMSTHSYLAANVNVCTHSCDKDLIYRIETVNAITPSFNMTYVFDKKIRAGYEKYVSIRVGKVHRWRSARWNPRGMKVLQYSFIAVPDGVEARHVLDSFTLRRKKKGKKRRTKRYLYAVNSTLVFARTNFMVGNVKLDVYKYEVVDILGPNWRGCTDEELSDFKV